MTSNHFAKSKRSLHKMHGLAARFMLHRICGNQLVNLPMLFILQLLSKRLAREGLGHVFACTTSTCTSAKRVQSSASVELGHAKVANRILLRCYVLTILRVSSIRLSPISGTDHMRETLSDRPALILVHSKHAWLLGTSTGRF
jgi:hypothetical protein